MEKPGKVHETGKSPVGQVCGWRINIANNRQVEPIPNMQLWAASFLFVSEDVVSAPLYYSRLITKMIINYPLPVSMPSCHVPFTPFLL